MDVVQISVSEQIERVMPLLRAHWDEVAKNKELMQLKPRVDVYRAMENDGALIALGAFSGPDLVGYSVTMVSAHLHYADLIYAHNDVIFVAEQHRAGRLGLKLIRETERQAKERGARLMLWHAKPDTAFNTLLPRLGYGVQDIVHSREL
jgi:predicted GNAT superfamily acetyltransferase